MRYRLPSRETATLWGKFISFAHIPQRAIMVDFRITWTLPIGEVSKPRLLRLEKSGL